MMLNTYNLNTLEVEAEVGRALWVGGQPGLLTEFRSNKGHPVKPLSLKTKKQPGVVVHKKKKKKH